MNRAVKMQSMASKATMVMAVLALLLARETDANGRTAASNLHHYCTLTSNSRPEPTALRDMRWLHFPKAGTSFGTLLAHYACPGIPSDAAPGREDSPNFNYMVAFVKKYMNHTTCDGFVTLRSPAGHHPLTREEQMQGNLVALFRDPRHRDFSGWRVHGTRGTEFHPYDLHDYVEMHRACQIRMMLGLECNTIKNMKELYFTPTPKQVKFASELLSHAFAFVGLTDYWNESVCLFHAMFGGDITPKEMLNVRPGVANLPEEKPSAMDIDVKEDPYDWDIYMVSRVVANENKHGSTGGTGKVASCIQSLKGRQLSIRCQK
eukprot:m.250022 g.250022  ORF g.250022 m.250022 type:complete len:319 (-) comp17172_c0_seq4:48-1004(-)